MPHCGIIGRPRRGLSQSKRPGNGRNRPGTVASRGAPELLFQFFLFFARVDNVWGVCAEVRILCTEYLRGRRDSDCRENGPLPSFPATSRDVPAGLRRRRPVSREAAFGRFVGDFRESLSGSSTRNGGIEPGVRPRGKGEGIPATVFPRPGRDAIMLLPGAVLCPGCARRRSRSERGFLRCWSLAGSRRCQERR